MTVAAACAVVGRRGGEDDDVRIGSENSGISQRDSWPLLVTVTASGSGDRAGGDPALSPLGLREHAPVVLGGQRPGSDQHRVGTLAQRAEQLAVAGV